MTKEEKLKRLLEMQEYPERYTETEIHQLMADEECRMLYEQMVKATDVLFSEKAEKEGRSGDMETPTNNEKEGMRRLIVSTSQFLNPTQRKFAALFIGVLLLSGIAYAAIHFIGVNRQHSEDDLATPNREQPMLGSRQQNPQQSTDTLTIQPKLYDNVPLVDILTELSVYYNYKTFFRDDAARHLRLFYQWRPDYSLEKVVEMLNNFEALHCHLEGDTLFVSLQNSQQP